jgi:hypothetical protein
MGRLGEDRDLDPASGDPSEFQSKTVPQNHALGWQPGEPNCS